MPHNKYDLEFSEILNLGVLNKEMGNFKCVYVCVESA